jgi:hypothetical protein
VLSIKPGHNESPRSNYLLNRGSCFDSNKVIDIKKLTEKGSDRSMGKFTSLKIDLLDQVEKIEKNLCFSESRKNQDKTKSKSSKQNPITGPTTPGLEVKEPEKPNENVNKTDRAFVESTTSLDKREKARLRGLFGGTKKSETLDSNQEPKT